MFLHPKPTDPSCPILDPRSAPSAVLPSFEVTLDPQEKFLYIDRQEDFRVTITARWGGRPNTTWFGVGVGGHDGEDGPIPPVCDIARDGRAWGCGVRGIWGDGDEGNEDMGWWG